MQIPFIPKIIIYINSKPKLLFQYWVLLKYLEKNCNIGFYKTIRIIRRYNANIRPAN